VKVHAINRSIRTRTIDTTRALEARRAMLGYDALGEIEQQFQLPMEGTAGDVMGWFEIRLKFDVEFYNAPDSRMSPYTLPHFTYGYVITTPTPVLVAACVREWTLDDIDTVSGAKVAIGTCNPGLSQTPDTAPVVAVPFAGYMHLTFQGFGAPAENNSDVDIGE
jgi:hypothetical protein